jgi:DNA topoisomerase-1
MAAAVLDTVSVEIENSGFIFKTGGYVIKSKGYLTIYDYVSDDPQDPETEELNLLSLPNIKRGEVLHSTGVKKQQHYTEPPARYTEASLIKFLEENGIGRPSTYAPIISIIISREYVKRDGKSLVATPLGEITTNFMRKHFPEIIDYEFTASMEDKLDSIEQSQNTITGVISEFYTKFEAELEAVSKGDHKVDLSIPAEESDVICDKCGSRMVYKNGRFGKFLACPNYPECKCTKAVDKNGKVAESEAPTIELAGFKCEVCGGEMVIRNGRYGSFYACQNYPTCTFTKQKVTETGVNCPKCNSRVLARHGKGRMLFYSCEKYPECDFSTWDMPLVEKCPDCGGMLYYRKSRKSVICKEKACGYKRDEEMTVIE